MPAESLTRCFHQVKLSRQGHALPEKQRAATLNGPADTNLTAGTYCFLMCLHGYEKVNHGPVNKAASIRAGSCKRLYYPGLPRRLRMKWTAPRAAS
ncbi:hypothetical protein ACVW1C_007049 [Bradyrhizobium sp. USDA 4011]